MSDDFVFRSVRRPDRRRRTVAWRLLKWAIVVAIVALVVVIGLLVRKAATALEPVDIQTLVLNDMDPDAPQDDVEGTSTTLVVGVDRRAVQPESIASSTADPRGAALALQVSLLQTSPAREGTVVINFPADLQVRPPGLLDIGTTRLDQVQALGGPDALVATIQDLTQMPIDHYVEIDLAGVVGVVDAVGGVDVCLDEVTLGPEPGASTEPASDAGTASPSPAAGAATVPGTAGPAGATASDGPAAATSGPADTASPADTTSPADTATSGGTPAATPDAAGTAPSSAPEAPADGQSAGCQLLDGAAAAGFLSSRADANQPLAVQRQRIAEQHYLIAQVLDRMRLTSVLRNPFRVNDELDALPEAVASDVDPGLRGMFEVAGDIADFDPDELIVRVVPSYRRSEGGDTLVYVDQATTLFQAVREGEDLTGVGVTTSDELGPEDVTVVVVNGVGTPGLAGSAQSYLSSRGFTVACAVNPSDLDPRADFDESQENVVLQYLASDAVLAELVVEALGSIPVEELEVEAMPPQPDNPECVFDDGPANVVMTVGSTWE
ncbi:MAG TPA: LCP family protein [Nitriliruptoraceae bacterium]|nr:LCP family protein [Nitriliruptoraceae bacterium]